MDYADYVPQPEGLAEVAKRIAESYPELYRHQVAGVAFLRHRRRAILADEMGLGKSRTAIVAAREEAPDGPFLVICPASVKPGWLREIKLVEPGADVQVLDTGGTRFEPGHRWTVVNYELLSRDDDALQDEQWAVVVIDEAHYIKNDAVRSGRCLELLGAAGRTPSGGPSAAYLLTGTPIANRPRDLFNLLKGIRHPLATNFPAYARRYCDAHHNGYGLDADGASHLEELGAIVSGVMLRRTKSDAVDLPEKVRRWIPVDVPVEHVCSVERRALDYYVAEQPAHSGRTWSTFVGMLARARHDLALVKARATADLVSDCVDAGQKVVVFTSYTGVVQTMRERFNGTCVTLTGKDNMKRRAAAVARYQTDDSIRVFVGNVRAAGVGIDLSAGTHVVFNDLGWVPSDHWQAEDRIHRIGQPAPTFATYVHAPWTLDEPVAAMLVQKEATVAALDIAARDEASFIEQVVSRALDGPAADGVHTDPAVPPRPTMGLCEEAIDEFAWLIPGPLGQHSGEARFEFPSRSEPGVVHTVHLRNGVAVCDCRGFEFTGNCWHIRDVVGRFS